MKIFKWVIEHEKQIENIRQDALKEGEERMLEKLGFRPIYGPMSDRSHILQIMRPGWEEPLVTFISDLPDEMNMCGLYWRAL